MTTQNNSLSLEDLLNSMKVSGLDKQASDSSDEEKKMKADEDENKKNDAQLKSDEKKEEEGGEGSYGQEKSAAEQGAEYARIMTEKVASMTIFKNSPSAEAGNTLADALLARITKQAEEKKAAEGDLTSQNGATEGAAGKAIRDNAQMVAEDDQKVKPMPLGDGNEIHGNVDQIFDAIMADAAAQGAVGAEQHPETGVAAKAGEAADGAVPNQVKTAALFNLLEQGVNFDEAVSMVKSAAEEIEDELEKAAAIDYLVGQGLDFDEAYNLVKQAEEELKKEAAEGDLTSQNGATEGAAGKAIRDSAQMVAEDDQKVKPMPLGDGNEIHGNVDQIFDALIADAVAQGAAGAEQHPEGGVAAKAGAAADGAVPNQVKTAAVKNLMNSGFDYEEAVRLVKSASEKAETMVKKAGVGATLVAAAKPVLAKGRAMLGMAGNTVKEVAKVHPVATAGAALAAGAAGAALAHKKQAALGKLMEQGVDFVTAAQLVEAKSKELFGE